VGVHTGARVCVCDAEASLRCWESRRRIGTATATRSMQELSHGQGDCESSNFFDSGFVPIHIMIPQTAPCVPAAQIPNFPRSWTWNTHLPVAMAGWDIITSAQVSRLRHSQNPMHARDALTHQRALSSARTRAADRRARLTSFRPLTVTAGYPCPLLAHAPLTVGPGSPRFEHSRSLLVLPSFTARSPSVTKPTMVNPFTSRGQKSAWCGEPLPLPYNSPAALACSSLVSFPLVVNW
jgi:hypothetical protein